MILKGWYLFSPGISGQKPGISRQNFWFSGFRGTSRTVWPPPLSDPCTWKTPTPPKNIRTKKFGFGFLLRAWFWCRVARKGEREKASKQFSIKPLRRALETCQVWGSPKASRIKANHPHFPHFPRLRVRIFSFSAFSAFSLCGVSSDPCFSGVRETIRIFRIFTVSGSNRWFRKSDRPALGWPALGDRESHLSAFLNLAQNGLKEGVRVKIVNAQPSDASGRNQVLSSGGPARWWVTLHVSLSVVGYCLRCTEKLPASMLGLPCYLGQCCSAGRMTGNWESRSDCGSARDLSRIGAG